MQCARPWSRKASLGLVMGRCLQHIDPTAIGTMQTADFIIGPEAQCVCGRLLCVCVLLSIRQRKFLCVYASVRVFYMHTSDSMQFTMNLQMGYPRQMGVLDKLTIHYTLHINFHW